jgi:hypothetical protein
MSRAYRALALVSIFSHVPTIGPGRAPRRARSSGRLRRAPKSAYRRWRAPRRRRTPSANACYPSGIALTALAGRTPDTADGGCASHSAPGQRECERSGHAKRRKARNHRRCRRRSPHGRHRISKVLAFDLACLCLSIEGATRVPAFLIHDSSREADLGLSIYDELFRLMRELEALTEITAFQYIVTTTTRPPDDPRSGGVARP